MLLRCAAPASGTSRALQMRHRHAMPLAHELRRLWSNDGGPGGLRTRFPCGRCGDGYHAGPTSGASGRSRFPCPRPRCRGRSADCCTGQPRADGRSSYLRRSGRGKCTGSAPCHRLRAGGTGACPRCPSLHLPGMPSARRARVAAPSLIGALVEQLPSLVPIDKFFESGHLPGRATLPTQQTPQARSSTEPAACAGAAPAPRLSPLRPRPFDATP